MVRYITRENVNKDYFNFVSPKRGLKVGVFDSPEEYVSYLRSMPAKFQYNNGNRDAWAGGSFTSCVNTLETGSDENRAKVEAILSKLDVSDLLTYNMQVLETAIAGFVPNVPAYIAGQPESMFRLEETEQPNVNAPIRVYVETSVSGGISQAELLSRGVAAAAFIMAMNTVRPVELYTFSVIGVPGASGGTYGAVVKLPSQPMDLQRALYMLTSPGMARCIGFSSGFAMAEYNSSGNVPWPFDGLFPANNEADKYSQCARALLEMEPHDVFLCGGHLFDKLLRSDPIAWVNKKVRENSNTGDAR